MINTKLNKALRKNENTVVMLLLLHRPPCDVTVFCAFEILLPMSAQKRHWQQQLVPRWWRRNSKTDCSYTNRLLYTEIDPTTWIERLHSACRHSHSVWRFHGRTLIQRQSWSQTISVVCAGNRNNTASLLMEWYYLASKQRLVWIGTLYIYDPISLLAFSMCHQWPGKAGLHRLSLCAAVDILRYTCCGPAVQLMRPDEKQTANIMILYSALCLNFSIKKLAITWEDRECVATQVTYSFKHKHEGVPANVTTLESSTLWQCVARQVSPGSLKDLHPSVTNEPQPLLTHTMHMGTPQRLACSATPL